MAFVELAFVELAFVELAFALHEQYLAGVVHNLIEVQAESALIHDLPEFFNFKWNFNHNLLRNKKQSYNVK